MITLAIWSGSGAEDPTFDVCLWPAFSKNHVMLDLFSKNSPTLYAPLTTFLSNKLFTLLIVYKSPTFFCCWRVQSLALSISYFKRVDHDCSNLEWSLPYHCNKCQNNFLNTKPTKILPKSCWGHWTFHNFWNKGWINFS